MKFNIENVLAEGMEAALNSDENKKLFSNASVLEKLAFKRVSEEDAITEIEADLASKDLLAKTASCKCNEPGHKDDCKCDCHKETEKDKKHEHKHEKDVHEKTTASFMVDALIKISADLDADGFDKLAAASLILADRIVVEAKAKAKAKSKSEKSKSKSSKDKKDSKDKPKSKVDMKDRMKKMREMQGKKDKKDSKKSEKK